MSRFRYLFVCFLAPGWLYPIGVSVAQIKPVVSGRMVRVIPTGRFWDQYKPGFGVELGLGISFPGQIETLFIGAYHSVPPRDNRKSTVLPDLHDFSIRSITFNVRKNIEWYQLQVLLLAGGGPYYLRSKGRLNAASEVDIEFGSFTLNKWGAHVGFGLIAPLYDRLHAEAEIRYTELAGEEYNLMTGSVGLGWSF